MASFNPTLFNLSDTQDEFDTVASFLKDLPDNLRGVFDHPSFISSIENAANPDISAALFFTSFNEAQTTLHSGLFDMEQRRYKDEVYRTSVDIQLATIGYTGASLKLKGSLLNNLWHSFVSTVEDIGKGVVDFAITPIVQTARKFLVFLNSCLGSLSRVIPYADAIKEIKEVGESFLNMV